MSIWDDGSCSNESCEMFKGEKLAYLHMLLELTLVFLSVLLVCMVKKQSFFFFHG